MRGRPVARDCAIQLADTMRWPFHSPRASDAGEFRDAKVGIEIGGYARQHPVDAGLVVDRRARLEGERAHGRHASARPAARPDQPC
jgi:hypothetical protein